jgi:hypothetical protein
LAASSTSNDFRNSSDVSRTLLQSEGQCKYASHDFLNSGLLNLTLHKLK